MKLQPFYIGQRVIALTSCRGNFRKSGNIYIVLNIVQCLGCNLWVIDIGERCKLFQKNQCSCGNLRNADYISWHGYKQFAPIQEGFCIISFTKILEEELVCVN